MPLILISILLFTNNLLEANNFRSPNNIVIIGKRISDNDESTFNNFAEILRPPRVIGKLTHLLTGEPVSRWSNYLHDIDLEYEKVKGMVKFKQKMFLDNYTKVVVKPESPVRIALDKVFDNYRDYITKLISHICVRLENLFKLIYLRHL